MDRHALAGADARHPFAQRRDGDLAADDDERHEHVGALQMHQHQQRGADEKLVGHRIEKGAEGRGLVELARQVAVEPVGGGEHDEHDRGDQVARRFADRQVENADDQRNRDDARPGHDGR
ncbi:hypothetical protein D3C72_1935420 [compost metagenome]